jgi:hypothetical protein
MSALPLEADITPGSGTSAWCLPDSDMPQCNGARLRATASAYCNLRTFFPKVISGLRRPIAIQAAISFNTNLPE